MSLACAFFKDIDWRIKMQVRIILEDELFKILNKSILNRSQLYCDKKILINIIKRFNHQHEIKSNDFNMIASDFIKTYNIKNIEIIKSEIFIYYTKSFLYLIDIKHPSKNIEKTLDQGFDIIKNLFNHSSKSEHTLIINGIIGQIGMQNSFKISGKGFDVEWLFDLVWSKINAKGYMIKLPLVLESEISTKESIGLDWDFTKLLVCNSDYKIFVCKFNDDNKSRIINDLKLSKKSYTSYTSNSKLYFYGWNNSNSIFEKIEI